MVDNNTKVLGWGTIIAILLGVAVVTGLLLGLLGETVGLSPFFRQATLGVVVGVAAAILIARRAAAVNEKNR